MAKPSKPLPKHAPTDSSPCAKCSSRHKGIFCEANESALGEIDRAKISRQFETGEILFRAGDELAGILCIRAGAIKLVATSEAGEGHLLRLVEGGGVLGLRALLGARPADVTAIAVKPTQICSLPKALFEKLLLENPAFALAALRSVALDLEEMESRFCHSTELSAVDRVAEALVYLKDRLADQNWSRRELAEWAGTTPETVIRALAQFEKEGLIALDARKITILNREGLLDRAGISF